MLLVIFGAGASYDSVPHLPPRGPDEEYRPPLANELFDTRRTFVDAMDEFPDCKVLIPLLRKPGVVVERELAKIQEQTESFPPAHRELASVRFYIQLALWNCERHWDARHHGVTNYGTLLREIDRWRLECGERICFVTFNYDTMLEKALRQVLRFERLNFDSYISWENYVLIKLHGSVDWGREVDGIVNPRGYIPQMVIDEALKLLISDRYTFMQPSALVQGEHLIFPAVSIPVEKKNEFSCPANHVTTLKEALPKVTKIITIGWRGAEADFGAMLFSEIFRRGGSPDLMFVSGSPDGLEETKSNVIGWVKQCGGIESVDSGFTGLITHELSLLQSFLRN